MPRWEKIHSDLHADGSRGRVTWRLQVTGGWLVLVRAVDDAVWGGLAFIPDEAHALPPEAIPDPPRE